MPPPLFRLLSFLVIVLSFTYCNDSQATTAVKTDAEVAERVDSLYEAGRALIQTDYERAMTLVQESFLLGYENAQDSLVGMRKVKIATYANYVGDTLLGLRMLQEVRSMAEAGLDTALMTNVYSEIVQYNSFFGDPDSIDFYMERSLAIIDTLAQPTQYASYLRRKAELTRLQFDMTEAARLFTKSLTLYDEYGGSNLDSGAIVGILVDLGATLAYTGSYDKAFPYFKRALGYFVPGEPGYAYVAARSIPTLTALQENELAKRLIEEVLLQRDASTDERYLAWVGSAAIAVNEENYLQAISFIDSLAGIQTIDRTAVFDVAKLRSVALLHLNRPEELRESIAIIVQTAERKNERGIADLLRRKADIVLAAGPSILPAIEGLIRQQDSVSRADQYLELAEYETRYRTADKDRDLAEKEVELAKVALANQRWETIAALGAALIFFLLAGLFFYRRSERRMSRLNDELARKREALATVVAQLETRNAELDGLNLALTQSKDRIETLNTELNHRVKNNLAFMSGVFQMQSRRTTNEEAIGLLQRMQSRIDTLNAAHELLGSKVNGDQQLEIEPFLLEVTENIRQFHRGDEDSLVVDISIGDVEVVTASTIRIGLIINELIANTMKHTISVDGERNVRIGIEPVEENGLIFRYSDQALAIPDWRLARTDGRQSMGTKLIDLLVGNIGGSLEIVDGEVVVRVVEGSVII